MADAPLVVVPEGVEVLAPDQAAVEIIAAPRPFSAQRLYVRMGEGQTISQILAALGIPDWAHARVFIDDWLVPRSAWPYVKPKAGRRVTVRVVPSGGGGDSNKTWRIVLLVVIAIVVLVLTVLSYGATSPLLYLIPAAAIGIGGSIAVNALFPPPKSQLPQLGGAATTTSPTLAITGARNQVNLYGPIPRPFGRHGVFPPSGARA